MNYEENKNPIKGFERYWFMQIIHPCLKKITWKYKRLNSTMFLYTIFLLNLSKNISYTNRNRENIILPDLSFDKNRQYIKVRLVKQLFLLKVHSYFHIARVINFFLLNHCAKLFRSKTLVLFLCRFVQIYYLPLWFFGPKLNLKLLSIYLYLLFF